MASKLFDLGRYSTLTCFLVGVSFVACKREPAPGASGLPLTASPHLTIGAYTTIREVCRREILPAFASELKRTQGTEVIFEESYTGSGAQSRAIISGFEADVAALSLEADIQRLVNQGLVRRDWKTSADGAIVSQSIVVIAVRKGNPKGIKDWSDLGKPGIALLIPDPQTSGGARWNILAIYGSANRKRDNALELLLSILRNVVSFDKGARESMIAFESGTGDAAITYENEAITSQLAGMDVDYVIPSHTILVENPAAVVEMVAGKHQTSALAQQFIAFLLTAPAQAAFSKYGFRPLDPQAGPSVTLPPVENLFTIADLGGWGEMEKRVFGPGALFQRALERAHRPQ